MSATDDRIAAYRAVLATLDDPLPFILAESNLPGPRGNLELVAALGDVLDAERAAAYSQIGPDAAPGDQPAVIAVVGGIVALGRLIAEGDVSQFVSLRVLATDARWRVREGVAMALQRVGIADPGLLLGAMADWAADDDPLVQRAVVAGLCEPVLLVGPVPRRVLEILDRVTTSFVARGDRRSDGARALRKALGYGWSVAIAAAPAEGLARFGRWLDHPDRDARWIVRENLSKARLKRTDPAWWEATMRRLEGR